MKTIYVDHKNRPALHLNPMDSVMALGYFDGVHLGHKKVIEAAKNIAEMKGMAMSVLSFFPHPKSVLFPNEQVCYLEPLEERMLKFERLGVDLFYVVPFDLEFAKRLPAEFIENYVLGLGAKHIVCGFDYTYGAKASGNVKTLQQYENEHIGITIIEQQCVSQQKISSTIVRKCLKEGKVDEIPQYLGEHYKTKWCRLKGVSPYYSLPAPGEYIVLLDHQQQSVESKVTVTTDRQLEFDCRLPNLQNSYTVSWLQNIDA